MTEWLAGTPLEIIPGATLGALVAGALLPLLGLWVVLQRVVFLGITLAQVAAAGVALGLFLHLPALAAGFSVTLLVVLLFTFGQREGIGRTGDASLGAAFCAAAALSLLFVSRSPVELDQVHHVLHGNLIYATPRDVLLVAAAALGGLLIIALFRRPILFSAFDPETAAALGLATRGWLLVLFGVLAVVLAVSVRTTGSLLTFALMVLPSLAALQHRRGLASTFLLSSLFGLLGSVGGLLLAVHADLHLESCITVCVFVLLPASTAWRRHPALGLAVLGLVVSLALLVPVAPGEAGPDDDGHGAATDYDVVVRLTDPRPDGDGLSVAWSFDLHRAHADAPLPGAFWLVISAGDAAHEVPLVEDSASLVKPVEWREGRVSLPVPADAVKLTGQVWSGPLSAADAMPVDAAEVFGVDLPGAERR